MQLFTDTKVYRSTYAALTSDKFDVLAQQGGTYSGKTFGVILAAYTAALNEEIEGKFDIVGQTMPHLKEGALQDFETISGLLGGVSYANSSEKVFKVGKVRFKFLSVDKLGKAKGGKRQYLFINEANELDYAIATQLMLRTDNLVVLDWNPSHKFWFHDELLKNPNTRVLFKRSTYKDNPSVSEKKAKDIEGLKYIDEELHKVYCLGFTGKIKAIIFKNVVYVAEFPNECKKIGYGMDFGFTNDPTTLIKLGLLHGELYAQELIFETGLTNPDICNRLKELGLSKNDEIYADSSEPKSIKEIKNDGWNIKAAKKGQDSVKFGISLLAGSKDKKGYKINITHGSLNMRKEAQCYKWKEKDGKILNVPIDKYNHCWDATRYYAIMKLAKLGGGFVQFAKRAKRYKS